MENLQYVQKEDVDYHLWNDDNDCENQVVSQVPLSNLILLRYSGFIRIQNDECESERSEEQCLSHYCVGLHAAQESLHTFALLQYAQPPLTFVRLVVLVQVDKLHLDAKKHSQK